MGSETTFWSWLWRWVMGLRCVSAAGSFRWHCIHRDIQERITLPRPPGRHCQDTPEVVHYFVHTRDCCR